MAAATACSDMLEEMGFEATPKREAHTMSAYVPQPNRDTTGGDIPGEQKVRTTLTHSDCLKITDMPANSTLIIVEHVTDGDTVRALNMRDPIRLWGVDAPEVQQNGGTQATEFLRTHLKPGDLIMADILGTDQYGRNLAVISRREEANINHLMVEQGWAFPYYGPGDLKNSCLESAQRFVRTNFRGMWGMQENGGTRPWVWRKQQRETGEEK